MDTGLRYSLLVVCSVALWPGCSGTHSRSEEAAPAASLSETTASVRCELPGAGYSEACNACLAARCCEPLEACKGDAACAEQLSCEVQCQYDADPGACTAGCFAAGPQLRYTDYDDCSFADCRSSCWT